MDHDDDTGDLAAIAAVVSMVVVAVVVVVALVVGLAVGPPFVGQQVFGGGSGSRTAPDLVGAVRAPGQDPVDAVDRPDPGVREGPDPWSPTRPVVLDDDGIDDAGIAYLPVLAADGFDGGSDADDAGLDRAGLPEITWRRVESELRRSLDPAIGWSVAIAIDGRVVRTVTGGRRSLDDEGPVEAHHRFRIASLSKTVTALAAMSLVDDGVLDLDEPIGGVLASVLGVEAGDPRFSEVTAASLLSHTSGVRVHHAWFFGNGVAPCRDTARRIVAAPMDAPGAFRYSNANTCLLSVLLEHLTGTDHETFVRTRLLDPLGASAMRLAGTYDRHPDEALHPSRPGRGYMEALGAAGGWVASPSDVVAVLATLDPRPPGWRPAEPDTLSAMARPPAGSSASYGLGLMVFPDRAVGHTGTVENTRAMAVVRPDGIAWAAMVNGEHPGSSGDLRRIVDGALVAAGIVR